MIYPVKSHMKTANKLKTYTAAGYLPNKTLIITSEDAEHPFTGAQASAKPPETADDYR